MDDNDWDLFAVVRGCSAAAPPELLPLPEAKDVIAVDEKGNAWWFPDTSVARHELDQLYRPFYVKPGGRPQPPLLMAKPNHPSSSSSVASIFPVGLPALPYRQHLQPRQAQRPVSQTPPRSKRRKNQQKKVVRQVPADGVSSDMWAWRKYGQKPIKGSPYPRGYYRCSSSKGCQARKQVERSRADPGMLLITYTAEHNHPVPTHRNSLSGSTRQKLPPLPEPTPANCEQLPSSLSSPRAAPRFSPAMEKGDGEDLDEVVEEEDDEEDEEDVLTVGDVEMMGEEEMLFLGMEVIDASAAAAAAATGVEKSPATVSVSAAFFEEEDDFFASPWLTKK